jgi:hypothetical protein
MNINECYPSKHVQASDLIGQVLTVTIREVRLESVGEDNKVAKPIIYFAGMQKGMVLNKTNACQVVGLYGSETNNWTNKPIMIYPTECEYKGKMVPCIRIKSQAPVPTQQAPTPEPPLSSPANDTETQQTTGVNGEETVAMVGQQPQPTTDGAVRF